MTVSKVNPAGLSLFMRHLAAVTKKYDDRDKARESLGNHLRKLKKRSTSKDASDINNKIDFVLEKEMEILKLRKKDSHLYDDLIDEIEKNKNRMEQLNSSLRDLKQDIKKFTQSKLSREERINRLEKKIKIGRNRKGLDGLSRQLDFLESKYNELKNNPNIGSLQLTRLKTKIDSLKIKLACSQF